MTALFPSPNVGKTIFPRPLNKSDITQSFKFEFQLIESEELSGIIYYIIVFHLSIFQFYIKYLIILINILEKFT